MMNINVYTIFSTNERSDLKKAFQADQKRKAFLATPTYYPKYTAKVSKPVRVTKSSK